MAQTWTIVKEFYTREFGIDGWIVEMYANLDILCLCVSGVSNEDIVKFLEIPLPDVKNIMEKTLDFEGWEKTLPINPLQIFSAYDGTKSSVQHFVDFNSVISAELCKYEDLSHIKTDTLFYLCELYTDIEERIINEWV